MDIQRDAITVPVASQGEPSRCRGHTLMASAPDGGFVRDEACGGTRCSNGNLICKLPGEKQANVFPCGWEGGHVLVCWTKPAPTELAAIAFFRTGE
eukprot:scaffold9128_cov52-Attheya_sp.AAC.6